MDDAGGSDWLQAVQVVGLVAQAVLLAFSAWWARATVQEARAARREESDRFERERDDERNYRRREAEKVRSVDLERRLDRVLMQVVRIDEIRNEALFPETSQRSLMEIGIAKRKLRAALTAAATNLPQTGHLIHDQPIYPSKEQVDASLNEIERSLGILGVAARVPFEGE